MGGIENRGQFVATPLLISIEMACYRHISIFVIIIIIPESGGRSKPAGGWEGGQGLPR